MPKSRSTCFRGGVIVFIFLGVLQGAGNNFGHCTLVSRRHSYQQCDTFKFQQLRLYDEILTYSLFLGLAQVGFLIIWDEWTVSGAILPSPPVPLSLHFQDGIVFGQALLPLSLSFLTFDYILLTCVSICMRTCHLKQPRTLALGEQTQRTSSKNWGGTSDRLTNFTDYSLVLTCRILVGLFLGYERKDRVSLKHNGCNSGHIVILTSSSSHCPQLICNQSTSFSLPPETRQRPVMTDCVQRLLVYCPSFSCCKCLNFSF